MSRKIGLIIVTTFFISCGGSSFLSGGKVSKKQSPANNPNGNATGQNKLDDPFAKTPNDTFGDANNFGSGNQDGNNLGGGSGSYNDPGKCLFIVSGAYFGCHGNGNCTTYKNVFPGTTSGNPIKHGESFDSVGGVYLNSNDTAYEYGKGGREIDKAVDLTFDSIAISPGVEVEIRDGNGNVLLKSKGPAIRYSSDYSSDNPSSIAHYFQANIAKMPQWMQGEFQAVNFKPVRIPLHAARYVKVTKLPGVPCE